MWSVQVQRRKFPAILFLVVFAARCNYNGLPSIPKHEGNISILEEGIHHGRYLRSTIENKNLMDQFDSDAIRTDALRDEEINENRDERSTASKLDVTQAPYNIFDAIREANVYEATFAVLVYDPRRDKFIALFSTDHSERSGAGKLEISIREFAHMLRGVFPERFQGQASEDFAVAIGSGDYPQVKRSMLPHTEGVAPVLQFGSVFQDRSIYPNMVAMPMPGEHLGCFLSYSKYQKVCGAFSSLNHFVGTGISKSSHEASGQSKGVKWDGLVPQLIWRGSDFGGYLSTLHRPRYSQPMNNHIEANVRERALNRADELDKKIAATQALRGHYDELLPRWKGVVLTAEAELEVDLGQSQRELPWASIKFAPYKVSPTTTRRSGKKGGKGGLTNYAAMSASRKYKGYDEVGIGALGNTVSDADLARYKYHIDLAGGGGTTWTGTTQKLAMPGLLFHHVTPTKDYIHDMIQPWKHYLPVSLDLSDLREKFDWAEGHPEQAQRIADRASEFMRHLGSPQGFGTMFEEVFVQPMERIIRAYRPLSSSHPGMTWEDVLQSPEGSMMEPRLECSGISTSCRAFGLEKPSTHNRTRVKLSSLHS